MDDKYVCVRTMKKNIFFFRTPTNNYMYSFPIYSVLGTSLNSANGGNLYYCSTSSGLTALPASAASVSSYCLNSNNFGRVCYSANDSSAGSANSNFALTLISTPAPVTASPINEF